MTLTADSWVVGTPSHWTRGRLKDMIGSVANGVWGNDPVGDGTDVRCVRAADFDRTRQRVRIEHAPLRSIDRKALIQHTLRPGELVLEKSGGGEKQPVGMAVLFDSSEPAVCSNFCARLVPANTVEPRYLAYTLAAAYGQGLTQISIKQTTGIQNLDAEAFLSSSWAYPQRDEQRRIANFLDAETARVDNLIALRHKQTAVLADRIGQIVDGATAGDADALREISATESTNDWGASKLSRVCEVIPGFAFPSSGFLTDGTGMRLLRGVNVAPGTISWGEVVGWDGKLFPVPERFHLRAGDLVIGMDRPWISTGMRISVVTKADLPALLLQRVACLRPKNDVVMSYMYWLLRSRHFRLSVESELTGVSVPHLSGEQIGDFTFRLPPREMQTRISEALGKQVGDTQRLKTTIARQINLLTERRQALITATVTGKVDVSTATGRGIED
jgi:type I restriction enzyme S subunit